MKVRKRRGEKERIGRIYARVSKNGTILWSSGSVSVGRTKTARRRGVSRGKGLERKGKDNGPAPGEVGVDSSRGKSVQGRYKRLRGYRGEADVVGKERPGEEGLRNDQGCGGDRERGGGNRRKGGRSARSKKRSEKHTSECGIPIDLLETAEESPSGRLRAKRRKGTLPRAPVNI